jgi:hypothetical protein
LKHNLLPKIWIGDEMIVSPNAIKVYNKLLTLVATTYNSFLQRAANAAAQALNI